MTSEVLLALLGGLMFAIGGVGYKVGANGNVHTVQCAAFLSVVGTVVFGVFGWNEWCGASLFAIIIGVVVGVMQYVVVSMSSGRCKRTKLKMEAFPDPTHSL